MSALISAASVPILLLLLTTLAAAQGAAKDASPLQGGIREKALMKSGEEPWNIEALQLHYDFKNEVYTAEGNVVIYSQDRSITADWAQVDLKGQKADLKGNVELRYAKDWLKGDHVIWSLDSDTGVVDGGTVYFAQNGFYIKSDRIEKTGPTKYKLAHGSLTSCDPMDPAWSIGFGRMSVNTLSYAWALNASMWAEKVPVFYVPVAGVPVARGRQSGLLLPTMGSSEVTGYEFELPFYWAISDESDATFYPHYLQDRGAMIGLEYRTNSNTWGKGIWMLNYLHDEGDPEDLLTEGYPLDTTERWWLRARQKFELPSEIHGWLNLDVISDSNFTKEFKVGSSAYDFTEDAFKTAMGSGIFTDKNALQRESNLYLSRPWEDSLVAMDVHYWDNLDKSTDEYTLQQTPRFIYDTAPELLASDYGLYYSLSSSMVNYWRSEGDSGQRLDIRPRFYYPAHWGPYLNVEPSAALRSTLYQVDWESENQDAFQSRIYPDFQLDMNTQLSRVFPLKWGDMVAVQNTIRPEVTYKYRPFVDENGDLPDFDSVENVTERNEVQYGFSSSINTKRLTGEGKEPVYQELARFAVFQTFHFDPQSPTIQDNLLYDQSFFGNDAAVFGSSFFSSLGVDSEDDQSELTKKRSFSSTDVEVYLTPQSHFSLFYKASISPYTYLLNRYDYGFNIDSNRGQWLNLRYRVREDSNIDELISTASFKLLPGVTFSAQHDYSFAYQSFISQKYSILYQRGCWGLRFAVSDEDGVQKAGLSLNLLGIGEFGGAYGGGSGLSIQSLN